MKTTIISYALAKACIAFLVLLTTSTLPVLAQAKFAAQKGSLYSQQEKKYSTGIRDYYALSVNSLRQPHSIPTDLFISGDAKNVVTEEIFYTDKKEATSGARPAENNKETVEIESKDISFKPTSFTYPENSRMDIGITQYSADQLVLYAKVLKEYAKKNGFDTGYAFFSNMGMRSNKKRFFVINLTTMQIEKSGLVAHGRGQGPSVFDKQYSNQEGSKCTSLGRYKISKKYKGGYGEAYKMVGLDSTNKNAYTRNIVLHAMGCIPDRDGAMPACVSEGCPAVSTQFLSSLGKIIDASKKPILLWIFDSNLEEAVVEGRLGKDKPVSENNKQHSCAIHINSHDDQGIQ